MNLRKLSEKNPIVLFDGVCNLCNGAVQFIIRNDAKKVFLFAPLQKFDEGVAYETDEQVQLESKALSSIVLLQNGKLYRESTAVLRIAKDLRFPANLAYVFIIIPAFIRDAMYRFIGKNRYTWFGKKDQCMLPTPDLQARFI